MSPRISVVVPLFNSRATIAETLDSLLSQSLTDWEAIIVNDGSTDDGPEIAEACARRDPRLRVVHQHNRGLAGARNTGIASARGAFLHLLDADDSLRPAALARLLDAATKSEHGAAACGWECVGPSGEPFDWFLSPPDGSFGLEALLESNRAVVHAMLISRERLGDQRFDDSLPVVEDYDLWLRLAQRGVRWLTVPEPLAVYRVRPDSMSRATRTMWDTTRTVIQRAQSAARLPLERRGPTLSRLALIHAAQLAVRDPRGAAQILSEAPDDSWREPAAMARALHGGLPAGLGLPPSAWRSQHACALFRAAAEWVPDVTGHLSDTVFDHLAALTVDAGTVARALADRIGPEGRVALVGAGRNGRVVAEALAHRGIPFEVYDDDPAAAGRLAANFAVRTLEDLSRIGRGGVVILTPGEDASPASRIGRGAEVRRWSVEARDLARDARARLGLRGVVKAA